MREISPAVGMPVDDWITLMVPPKLKGIIEEIRRQKREGKRPKPSTTLIDRSTLLSKSQRGKLLDAIAALVDENYAGRSEMCLQFAALLDRALTYLRFPSRAALGLAMYYSPKGEEIHRWQHAWVRVGHEVIDGNVDCLNENPFVPEALTVSPYWGPITEVPSDRRLREEPRAVLMPDVDVDNVWWPELSRWIDQEMLGKTP